MGRYGGAKALQSEATGNVPDEPCLTPPCVRHRSAGSGVISLHKVYENVATLRIGPPRKAGINHGVTRNKEHKTGLDKTNDHYLPHSNKHEAAVECISWVTFACTTESVALRSPLSLTQIGIAM